MKVLCSLFIMVLCLSFMLTACSSSDTEMLVPEYPGAQADQEHKAGALGVDLASVRRVTTGDSFDTVLTFYKDNLAAYNPEIKSYDLEDGRQASITITENNEHVVTIAVQEFNEERLTAITYMKTEF